MGLGWFGVGVEVGVEVGMPEGTEGVATGTVEDGDGTSGGTTGSGVEVGAGSCGDGSCAWARVKMRANASKSTKVNLRVMMKEVLI